MDWAELNPDLLHQIAKKVGDISNFIRLRAVCKRWRSVIHPSDQPPQLPFYIEYKDNAESTFDLQFFSLYSNRTHTLPITKTKQEPLIGSSSRYIFVPSKTYKDSCTFGTFLNPITGSEVFVPFGCFIHPFHIGFGSNSNLGSAKNELHVLCYSKNVFSLIVPMDKLCLWHYVEGEYCWTRISDIPRNFDENIFYNGRSFIFPDQPTMVIDIKTGTLMSVCSDQFPQFYYLIEAGGELLGVKPFNICTRNYNIEVYRLEITGKDSCWIKLNDGIGDRAIILDSLHGFCFNASDFDGFTGNCIYFNGCYYTEDDHCKNGIIRYDMKSSESQLLYCTEENLTGTWFVPSLS